MTPEDRRLARDAALFTAAAAVFGALTIGTAAAWFLWSHDCESCDLGDELPALLAMGGAR